jgi:hypothetical protein
MGAFALCGVDLSLIADDQNSILILWTDFNLSDFSLLEIVLSFEGKSVNIKDLIGCEPKSIGSYTSGKSKFLSIEIVEIKVELFEERDGGDS